MARKYLSFLQLFVIILTACTSKQKKSFNKKEESHFSYFELSYKGDWFGGFSFLVDTNKIFFFPSTLPQISGDKIKYGILPDSLFQAIDSTITQIRTLQSLNPDSTYCFDCSEVSIKAILNSDTIRLYQAGIINDTIWNLIEKLEAYRKSDKLRQINTVYFYLETAGDVSAPMPPKILISEKGN